LLYSISGNLKCFFDFPLKTLKLKKEGGLLHV